MTRIMGVLVAALAGISATACDVVGPSCRDESGGVFAINGQVTAGGVASYTVTSPISSNLVMRLTWSDTAATLGFNATITDCGGHTGCLMITVTPPFGPGGPSPVPQPWPPGLREMVVDGWRGKTYRVEIAGDPDRDAAFTLNVTYRITCES